MNEKTERSIDQLGLPPMELAESSNTGRTTSSSVYNCLYATLQRVFMLLLLLVFSAGTYILLLKLIENTDLSHNTDIIVVTETKGANFTLHREDMDIFFQVYNKTSNSSSKRSKRSTLNPSLGFMKHIKDNDVDKVKEIILRHRLLCREKERKSVCEKLITQLKTIIDRNGIELSEPSKEFVVSKSNHFEETKNEDKKSGSEVKKREVHPLSKLKGLVGVGASSVPLDVHALPHTHFSGQPHITDTCLLAKLLKNNYPNVHGIYDSPVPEYVSPHIDQTSVPHMRYLQQPMSYLQTRELERQKPIVHPQDLEIYMNFLTPKPDESRLHVKENSTSRNVQCPFGTRSCDNGEDCIEDKLWCDGQVDCPDSSDEIICSCKSRVDSSRLCDGYFDCPLGEDEMGCFGCSENMFSCEDIGINMKSTCFSKEQRCNNIVECPNHKDEIDCNMLAPSLLKKPMFSILSTEGFLHRNFKGDWYAVCQNPYMWAHDACRRETGLIIRPPFIQLVPVDPMLKVSYLNTAPGGLVQQSDTCFNNSAVYVTCPDFLCGTRVDTTSQLLKESSENSLFGRNKRFLIPHPSFNPYLIMNYENRMKRDTAAVEENIEDVNSFVSEDLKAVNNRIESRVVGGKPSQPAAWPWMVAMYRDGMFHCGGVIFTQSWIISAAHCVHKFWDHYYEIQVGMLRRFSFSPQEQIHKVTHVIVNQHYRQVDMKNDLSLLKVEPSIQFSRWVRPICLPNFNTAGPDWLMGPAPGTICTAVGWGATAEHGPDPDHMREVEVPIWKNCKHREDVAGNEICAGLMKGGRDACQGDSGGPLLCRNPANDQQWYLVGIVSHGDGCARKDEPGVYTRVSLFVKWIKYHTSTQILPLVQPIQECPGFKCKFGILKCLPHSRRCDKIVDCLNAEDESDCEYKVSSIDAQEKMSSKMVRETEGSKTNEVTTSTLNVTSTDNPSNLNNAKSLKDASSLSEEDTDLISKSTEEDISASDENVTNDPKILSRNDVTENVRGDMETFAVTFTPVGLKSMSHQKQNVEGSDSIKLKSEENILTTLGVQKQELTETTTSIAHQKENVEESDGAKFIREESISITLGKEQQQVTKTTTAPLFHNSDTNDVLDNQFDDSSIKTTTEENISPTFTIEKVNLTEITTTLPLPNSDINLEDQLSDSSNNTETLIIELLPNIQSNDTDESTLNNSESNETNESTVNNSESDVTAKNITELTTDTLAAKNLPEAETKSGLVNNIEDLLFSELQAAHRKKHHIPQDFECKRIFQTIPFQLRCDHKADCEDGTDEMDCNCLDYLTAFNNNLICDGVFDCADGEDEIDCFSCPDQYFLCKRSEICLPYKYVCDGKPQCPSGEDEFNCFALTNGKEIFYDIDDKPKVNLEGFLTERKKDDWQVMCENDLSIDQQEQSAIHICHYLGFSNANNYQVKYVNVKEEDIIRSSSLDKRKRRNIGGGIPLRFTYRDVGQNNETARQIFINKPQVLKEECVPNVTKTCKSLYVYCDRSLYTDFLMFRERTADAPQNKTMQEFPWIAKVLIEGEYRCTGILVETSWVLVSDSCLWDTTGNEFVTVVLGSHRTLKSVTGYYEKIHKIDSKKYLYRNRVILLHMKTSAEYSNMVKPMIISSSYFHPDNNTFCVAVGQDSNNKTVSILLEETNKNCNPSNRCFVRRDHKKICEPGEHTHRHWAGLISCHNHQGWYPAASFVDSTGECDLGDTINATDIENLRYKIKHYSGQQLSGELDKKEDQCDGVRCGRGACVPFKKLCDGVKHCEDATDENNESCDIKHKVCQYNPFQCECALGEMKCRNGKCVPKQQFGDGKDDCGDGTDEPRKSLCSDYLARAMPSRLCDGVLHCHDRSDEDPLFCKCFAKRTFRCNAGIRDDVDHCVAPDMVCDGIPDCPNGKDERTCMGLSAPEGTPYGTGQVIVQSHGVWHSKCYPTRNHTRTDLERICRELGFLSGHAKQIENIGQPILHNNLVIDQFVDVSLNNQTSIKIRNSKHPIARAIVDEDLKECFPVFIECR